MSRKRWSKHERDGILATTGGRCAYCGQPVTLRDMQADHVVPLHRGGADETDNIVPACRPCNNRKSTFTVEEFRQRIAASVGVLERGSVTFRLAARFGLVAATGRDVAFHSEELLSIIADNLQRTENRPRDLW